MSNGKIKLIDTTMRDGSHAVRHSYTTEQISAIAKGLDEAGIGWMELSHGDGISGSSVNYGFSGTDEMELLKAAKAQIKNGMLGVLLLPGVGTIEDLKRARDCGADAVRVATHVTEADISIEHIKAAKEMGMTTCGFLMMTHMGTPEVVLEQAKIMEDAGADYINLADSAGYLTPEKVKSYVSLLVDKLSIPVGFHAHNNLGLAIGNSLAAVEAGVTYLDGTCRGLGAGAGNAQIEVLNAVLTREGVQTGVDVFKLIDVAEQTVAPIMQRPQVIDGAALMLGYAGVYSSFLLHTYRAAERFNVDAREILLEIGRRRYVGGQEDKIIDVANYLATQKKAESAK